MRAAYTRRKSESIRKYTAGLLREDTDRIYEEKPPMWCRKLACLVLVIALAALDGGADDEQSARVAGVAQPDDGIAAHLTRGLLQLLRRILHPILNAFGEAEPAGTCLYDRLDESQRGVQ